MRAADAARMTINIKHLRDHVIVPALQYVAPAAKGFYSPQAVMLLLGTMAVESAGQHLVQLGGPAKGLWQIEPATCDDIFGNYLAHRRDLNRRIEGLLTCRPLHEQLVTNLAFSAVMARLVYYRRPDALPAASDIPAQAALWKRVYNTPLGKGTPGKYIAAMRLHITPALEG